MGSYCSIEFDDMPVDWAKSMVPDDYCAVFQESDRVVRVPDDEEERLAIIYEAPREVVLLRLALLGCTAAVARERLEIWLRQEQEIRDENDDISNVLRTFTADDWYARVPRCLKIRYKDKQSLDFIDQQMCSLQDGWLHFDGYQSLVGLRALLDACPDVKLVKLDISDLVDGGYIEPEDLICETRRRDDPVQPRPLAATVVLAEGSSDIRVLQKSLAVLFPERKDYFSFFNHAELNVDGGTGYLIKFLKAFAAAQVPFRMIAVFDNDTVGVQAFHQANALGLPANIIIVHLPDIELARAYPTVGPQGNHTMNVNGQAASIELYLGRSALTDNGVLRPVQWTGYVQAASRYQGEVQGKGEVERAFLNALPGYANASDARKAFPELVGVWETVFAAVEGIAEAVEREFHGRARDI
jgi:hypothetical protein